MKMGKAIKMAMKMSNMTQKRLAEILGTTQGKIANNVVRDNITVNSTLEILNVIGYEIVVQPKRQGRRPDGQMVITLESEEKEEKK